MARKRKFKPIKIAPKPAPEEPPPEPASEQNLQVKSEEPEGPTASKSNMANEVVSNPEETQSLKKFVFPAISPDIKISGDDVWCIVCGKVLKTWDRKCHNMFETSMQFQRKYTYSTALANAINHSISSEDVPSKAICCQCCLQLEETARIELRLKDIRTDLNKLFSRTLQHLMIGTISGFWSRNKKKGDGLTPEIVEDDFSSDSDTNMTEDNETSTKKIDDESPGPAKIRIMDPASINKSVPVPAFIPPPILKAPEASPDTPLKCQSHLQKIPIEKILSAPIIQDKPPIKMTFSKQTMPDIRMKKPELEPETNSTSGNEMDPIALSNLLTEIKEYDPQTSNAVDQIQVEPDLGFLNNGSMLTQSGQYIPIRTVYQKIVPKSTLPTNKQPYIITPSGGMKILLTPSTSTPANRMIHIVPAPGTSPSNPSNLLNPRILGGGNNLRMVITKQGVLSTGVGKPRVVSTFSTYPTQNVEAQKQKRKTQHIIKIDSSTSTKAKISTLDPNNGQPTSTNHTSNTFQDSRDTRNESSPEKKRRGRPFLNKPKPESQNVDLNSILNAVTAEEGEAAETEGSGRPRRSAFHKASKRLEIIANYDHSKKFSHPKKWIADLSKDSDSDSDKGSGDEVQEIKTPAKKQMRLMEARVVLEKFVDKKSEDEKDVSMSSHDDSFSKSEAAENGDEEKGEVESVCNEIRKVILESPPEAKKKRKRSSMKGKQDSYNKCASESFCCDICKLDFLKLDELRNHIEQDHFAPSY